MSLTLQLSLADERGYETIYKALMDKFGGIKV
jgi:hypothetical protein